MLLCLLAPALPLGLHVLEHGICEARVPALQHADHCVQRGHLATEDSGQKPRVCSVSSLTWGDAVTLPLQRKGHRLTEMWPSQLARDEPRSADHHGAAPPKAKPPRSLQSPCQDHTGLHLPLLPSSLHTPATGPRGSLLVSTACRSLAAVPCLRGLPTDLNLQDTALGATLIPNLTTPVPLKSPHPGVIKGPQEAGFSAGRDRVLQYFIS